MENIEIAGHTYTVKTDYDHDTGTPWDNEDGHGVVSEWVRRDKRPSEMVLSRQRGAALYYDFAASTKIAKRDGWGVENSSDMTPGQITHTAVMNDFEHLQAWARRDWSYIFVTVTNEDGETRSIGGISTEDYRYLISVAQELAEELHAERVDSPVTV